MTRNNESDARYALLSVSDKTGIADLAIALVKHGFSILSTGGTARALEQAGVEVTGVSDHTGFPEIMDGRVKTLHPKIHGGILGRDDDQEVMLQQGISPIELVVVNLYAFEAVTAGADCTLEKAIEHIDIGGPAMVRAAAKNHARVAVLTDPGDYPAVIKELDQGGRVSKASRFQLAAKAYAHTAHYDSVIADYLGRRVEGESTPGLPRLHAPRFVRAQELCYGENPHQAAAYYTLQEPGSDTYSRMKQLQGKELSYNNIADADAAFECASLFRNGPVCIIVKHANPCGGAYADSLLEAYERAYATDPVSSFGGVIALSEPVDSEIVKTMIGQQFVEVVIAPGYSDGALEHFAKKPNIRVLTADFAQPARSEAGRPRFDYHRVSGGMLIQEHDEISATRENCRCVSARQAVEREWLDLMFAWKMVRMVKSNAIVYARDCRTLGIGAGQMSRVDSARIAAWKAAEAGLSLQGSAMASDAFFPFRDSIDAAAGAGVKAIIQPGGSMRDEEVIQAANEHDMTMVFTGQRHFRH